MEERKFDLMTDTGCDLPVAYLQEHAIKCVKLGFLMDGENYEGEDGKTIDEKTFYQKLRDGAMPTTYQVTAETAKEHIEKSLKNGRDILVLAFSSGLSGTAGSYEVAARELRKVYPERKICVVDTLCASMGQGLLVDYAVKKADGGASIEDTAAYIEGLKLHICHHFTVDNLFHLKRGGRVSAATAIVGSILKIKPVLHVDDNGKLIAIGKTIGRKKSLHKLVENLLETQDMDDNDPIFISHGDCLDDVEYVKGLLKERFPSKEIFVNYIGPVIGAHSGAGTIALFNKGTHR